MPEANELIQSVFFFTLETFKQTARDKTRE